MTIPEELRVQHAASNGGIWHRRVFQAPHSAKWVPECFEKLTGARSLPAIRGLRIESDGSWSVEEYVTADQMPLADYLTTSSAPVWIFVSIVQQCLVGLIAMHKCGLVHGMLSPENIRVDASGNVRLTGSGAGSVPPEWAPNYAAADMIPALPHSLALADLRDLGRAFRAVIGGDANTKMTVSRPEIAPLVAEWIDWIAEPPAGREALGAAHAGEVFSDIRTGRPGWKPWRNKAELPPELCDPSLHGSSAAEGPGSRRAAQAHGIGLEWPGLVLIGVAVLAILGGAVWALNHYFGNKPLANIPAQETSVALPVASAELKLAVLTDELPDVFHMSGGDLEPLPDTREVISKLMSVLEGKMPAVPEWERELELQFGERAAIAAGKPSGAEVREDSFLASPQIFPFMGKASAGRAPGDYYVVWRTERVVFTEDEARELQMAILRSARYCGVRLLAWTVLPNQAGVVLRIPPPRPLPDERLERRIAILRGEKTADSVIAKIDEKLKAGDEEGAKQLRLVWTASMGSAAGFYSVIKTVPVVKQDLLHGAPLWQAKPLHMALLDPDTPDVVRAAAIIDTAALTGKLVESASAWPLCSLAAAIHNYGPAMRSISVLMQRNPQASLPLPVKEELANSLRAYRRYLGDLPEESLAAPATDAVGSSPVHEIATKAR